jgi:ketosteroid isomerase-like protein
MAELPHADAATRAFFIDWLDTFAGYVREVDYASARPLFHPDTLAFGTFTNVIPSLQAWIDTQWDNVWPKTADFRFDLAGSHVLAGDDATMAVVIAPWTSTGFHPDGTAYDRPGRATMVFHRAAGRWVCVHSHMSLNRGVPQQSFANRPVKAR